MPTLSLHWMSLLGDLQLDVGRPLHGNPKNGAQDLWLMNKILTTLKPAQRVLPLNRMRLVWQKRLLQEGRLMGPGRLEEEQLELSAYLPL